MKYRVFFKNKDETPLWISQEGYNKLSEILTNPNPPKFVEIKGQLVNILTIDRIIES